MRGKMLHLTHPDSSAKYDLNQPRFTIGRDPSNDLVLDDSLISGFHATIFVEDGRVEIVDQGSSNGTYVNDNLVSGRVELKAWNTLKMGNVELEVVDSSGRRPTMVQAAITDEAVAEHRSEEEPVGVLQLQSSGSYPVEMKIFASLSIGRSADNDLCLASDTVSGSHARLEKSGGSLVLMDLGSTNGTWVNGKRIDRRMLKHGDQIRFDEVEYQLSLPGGEEDVTKTRVNPAIQDVASQTVVRPAVTEEPGPALDAAQVAASVVEPPETSGNNDTAATTILESPVNNPQPPPAMASPRVNRMTEAAPKGAGRQLTFNGTGLQGLGWGALAAVSCILVIPAAWGFVPMWRWLVDNMKFSDNTSAEFTGRPGQIWWMLALICLIASIPVAVSTSDQMVNLFISYGIPLLFLPLTTLLWLLIGRWFFQSIALSCGTRLHFNATFWPLLGWFAANMLAPLTIIGWAWIHTAFYRWFCSKVEGGGQQVIFHGKGHDYLWRVLLATLASIFIIPAPWMFVWLLRWGVDQIEVR